MREVMVTYGGGGGAACHTLAGAPCPWAQLLWDGSVQNTLWW
jgi:hypothetical protein